MITQKDIKGLLDQLLRNITEGFAPNELAYLSIQGKNELQIRDKIAWRMHQALQEMGAKHVVVRREWSPIEGSRDRVDLAILQLDSSNLKVEQCLALIEFKAQSLVRPERWYIDEFVKDIAKMKHICDEDCACTNADLYFVFLHSAQSSFKKAFAVAQAARLYANSKTTCCMSENDNNCIGAMHSEWKKFFAPDVNGHYGKSDHLLSQPKQLAPLPILQCLGEAYDVQCYIAPMTWGPQKSINIHFS